jgi:hypothetical protein
MAHQVYVMSDVVLCRNQGRYLGMEAEYKVEAVQLGPGKSLVCMCYTSIVPRLLMSLFLYHSTDRTIHAACTVIWKKFHC